MLPAQLLPDGFALPPLPYLAVVVLGTVGVAGLLSLRSPTVSERTVIGLLPWMLTGATGYALFQAGGVPAPVEPLFGSPTVYLTTFVVLGLVWAAVADRPDRFSRAGAPTVLLVVGTLVLLVGLAAAAVVGLRQPPLFLTWPVAVTLGSVVLAAAVWLAVRQIAPTQAGRVGAGGLLVVLGHTLDGLSTALGIAIGFGEQTPLSRLLIEAGNALPTAPYVGGAWVFVVVKVLLAAVVALVLADYVREEPTEGYLLLAVIAAVGLGPGFHNVVLFVVAG